MSMHAGVHALLVTPTGDDSQTETASGLIAVHKPEDKEQPVYRGVVLDVGSHVAEGDDGLRPGCVVHYTGYFPLQEYHVVPNGSLLVWESEDE